MTKRKLIYQIITLLAAVSMIIQIPTTAKAASEKSDTLNSAIENTEGLEEYLDGYIKMTVTFDSANDSLEEGFEESADGNEKEAIKEFKKSNKKFKKADRQLDDLDPPKSAKKVDDLTSKSIDKFKKGTKMMVTAEKSDDSEKAEEASELIAEGVGL